MKILKGIINVLLAFVLFILLTVLFSLFATQNSLSFIKVVHAADINPEDIVKINNLTPELIHKYADKELENRGITPEALDYILDEGNYQQMFKEYKQDCVDYLSGNGSEPKLPMEEINTMVDNGVTKYNKATGSNLKTDQIQNDVKEIVEKIDEGVKKINDNKAITTALKIINSKTTLVACGIAVGVILIILILINKVKKGLLVISIPTIISGISLLAINFIVNIDKLKSLLMLVVNNFDSLQKTFIISGSTLLVVGLILLIVSIVLIKKSNASTKKAD